MASPSFAFTGADAERLRQPLVYVLRAADGGTLYVGMSGKGATRPLNPDHHAMGVIAPDERLELYSCRTELEAAALEREMIIALQPSRNCTRWRKRAGELPRRPRVAAADRVEKGIRKTRAGWRAFARVRGRLYTKSFPADATVRQMRAWREVQQVTHGFHAPDYSRVSGAN